MRSRLFTALFTILLGGALLPISACASMTPQVYVLAGQSNMSGRGAIADLSPAERVAEPAIRLYGNDGRWRTAAEPLDSAEGQVDAVSADRQAAVGPGLFFARALRGYDEAPIDLVPCAKGGSSIGRWKPDPGRDTLYGSCLARVKEAGGKVAGILWYQGETDAERADAASAWTAAFEALAARLRQDLGRDGLPIVVVQLAEPPAQGPGARTYRSWTAIQAAQARTASSCVAVVSAGGLSKLGDDLHLDTAGQRLLGVRLAEAMRDLRRRGCR